MRNAHLLALAVLAGCTTVVEPRVGDEFTLGPGDVIRIAGTQLSVTFVQVAQDSRCPTRVQCVWAGDGAVELQIAGAGENRVATLHTNPEFDGEVDLGSFVLELVGLDPYPDVPDGIDPDQYEVTLKTRAPQ